MAAGKFLSAAAYIKSQKALLECLPPEERFTPALTIYQTAPSLRHKLNDRSVSQIEHDLLDVLDKEDAEALVIEMCMGYTQLAINPAVGELGWGFAFQLERLKYFHERHGESREVATILFSKKEFQTATAEPDIRGLSLLMVELNCVLGDADGELRERMHAWAAEKIARAFMQDSYSALDTINVLTQLAESFDIDFDEEQARTFLTTSSASAEDGPPVDGGVA